MMILNTCVVGYPNDAQAILEATRSQWTIKNSLHWVLDVIFREDQSRIRTGNSAQNMTVLRHLALNILKKDTSKGSLRIKGYKAALNTTFLETMLEQV